MLLAMSCGLNSRDGPPAVNLATAGSNNSLTTLNLAAAQRKAPRAATNRGQAGEQQSFKITYQIGMFIAKRVPKPRGYGSAVHRAHGQQPGDNALPIALPGPHEQRQGKGEGERATAGA